MTRAELKEEAKNRLEGKRKNAAILILVNIVIVSIVGIILNAIFPGVKQVTNVGDIPVEIVQANPISQILSGLLTIFFTLGMTSYFLKIARGDSPDVQELFSQGKLFLKGILISIVAGVLISIGFLLLIIPGIILALAYAFIYQVYIDNPELGITDVLKKSREMMKGHKWEYFVLQLSFFGWYLLIPLTLGIICFWLTPYVNTTIALFYDNLKGETPQVVEAVKVEETPAEENKEESEEKTEE